MLNKELGVDPYQWLDFDYRASGDDCGKILRGKKSLERTK